MSLAKGTRGGEVGEGVPSRVVSVGEGTGRKRRSGELDGDVKKMTQDRREESE